MIHNGRVLGLPLVQFVDSKAAIEALGGAEQGMVVCTADTGELGFYDGTSWWWLKGAGSSSWDKIILWHPAEGAHAIKQFPCTQEGIDQANAYADAGDYILFPPGECGPMVVVLKSGVFYDELVPGQTVLWHHGNGADCTVKTSEDVGSYYLRVRTVRMAGSVPGVDGIYAFCAVHDDGVAHIYADIECVNEASGVEAKACGIQVDGGGEVMFCGGIKVLSYGKHYGAYGVQLYDGTINGRGDITVEATNGSACGIQIRASGIAADWDGDISVHTQGPSSWPEYPLSGFAVGIQTRANSSISWHGKLEAIADRSDAAGLHIGVGAPGGIIQGCGKIKVTGNDRRSSGIALHEQGTVEFAGIMEVLCATKTNIAAYGVTVEDEGEVLFRGHAVVKALSAESVACGLRVSAGVIRAEHCAISTYSVTPGRAYDLYQLASGVLEAFCVRHDPAKVTGTITWLDGIDVRSINASAPGNLIVGGATDWEVLPHPGNPARVLQTTTTGVRWSESEPLMLDQSIPQTLTGSPIFGSLTTGRIPYVSGIGTLTDSDDLVWDAANERLGVGTPIPTAVIDVNSNIIRLRQSKTPANSGDTGNQGDICWDENYLYVCVAANTWKRIPLTSW